MMTKQNAGDSYQQLPASGAYTRDLASNIPSNEGVSTPVANYYRHIMMASQWEGSLGRILSPLTACVATYLTTRPPPVWESHFVTAIQAEGQTSCFSFRSPANVSHGPYPQLLQSVRIIIQKNFFIHNIVSDYRLDDWGSIPGRGKDFPLASCVHTSSEAHPASNSMDTGGPFPGGKTRPRHDTDHSPFSSVDVNNG
jgi:hypothetical protein